MSHKVEKTVIVPSPIVAGALTDLARGQGQGGLLSFQGDFKVKESVPFRSTEPFDGWSTQRADYVGRPAERVRRREPETYRKPEGELDLNTTARQAYTRKPMEKTSPIKPQEMHVDPGRFEGTTTARVSYRRSTTIIMIMTMMMMMIIIIIIMQFI